MERNLLAAAILYGCDLRPRFHDANVVLRASRGEYDLHLDVFAIRVGHELVHSHPSTAMDLLKRVACVYLWRCAWGPKYPLSSITKPVFHWLPWALCVVKAYA